MTTAGDDALLAAINDAVSENDDTIRLPMTALNQGIAALVAENEKVIQRVSTVLTRKLKQSVTDNDNDLDTIGTSMLVGLNGWIQENDLLLNHLAASAGLIQPGDPLTAALLGQVAEAPELAYSATLLIALRDALPYLGRMALSLERLAGAAGAAPAASQEDEDEEEAAAEKVAVEPLTLESWPDESLT